MPHARRPAFLSKLGDLPFVCFGAAHIDTIARLVEPAVRNRTNPVHPAVSRPGGVANNIACQLARLVANVTLFCPPPSQAVIRNLAELGIRRRNIGGKRNSCSYTAVLDPSGELEIGLADMVEYDRMGPGLLPDGFPGRGPGVAVLDAAFKPAMMRAAAKRAHGLGWQVAAAATSPAKVMRLDGIPLELLILNEAEAQVLAGEGRVREQAERIADKTGGWVAITQGAEGALLLADGRFHRERPPRGSVKDTTGAGDAFSAALIAAYPAVRLGLASPAERLRHAVAAGSRVARRR